MKINSPFNVKEIIETMEFPGFLYRIELVTGIKSNDDNYNPIEMENCYELENGEWIGNIDDARFYCIKLGLRKLQKINPEHCVCSIGFSEKEQKWYGWSHRACYGFGIGSTCKEGDCHYIPFDEEDAIKDGIRFWGGEDRLNTRALDVRTEDGAKGVDIAWEYSDTIPNEKLRGTTRTSFWRFPDTYGKGKWEATTLKEAKQMAIDFSNGVS